MTPDDFRDIVLALEGAVEGAHMGHPDFRANGRIFASLHSQDRFGMLKVTPEEQAALLQDHPETFEPSAGAWGRQGCTNVKLATADRRAVRGAARLAWEVAMAARPPRPRKAAATASKAGARKAGPRKAARKRSA
jgi:hypothetical protein